MSVFYERCPCTAEFRVEADTHDDARTDLATWRAEHKHEIPAGERHSDHVGSHHYTGFDTQREGRIEDVT